MMRPFKIACLCPTYKRPELLQNSLACFMSQKHDSRYRRLFILDDAKVEKGNVETVQHDPAMEETWELHTSLTRFNSLPEKYNRLVEIANKWNPDAYAIWEDDDVFFSRHLSQASHAFASGTKFFRTPQVWSNYGQPKGKIQLEGAEGRFHSSWVFTRSALETIGGWPLTERLDFDQQLGRKLTNLDPSRCTVTNPQYVYRWGNPSYHGSAHGEEGFRSLWDRLGEWKVPYVGTLIPKFDNETQKISSTYGTQD